MSLKGKRLASATPDTSIIVVSGLPRSGTSMMMAMLERGGIALLSDGLRAADEDNPRGYYEYEPVKGLKEGNISWLDQAQGKAVKIISYLLLKLPPSYHFHVIFMQRDLQEVIASQRKMLVRRQQNPNKVQDENMSRILHNHLTEVAGWLNRQKNIDAIEIPYDRIVMSPDPHLERIADFLDRTLDLEAMSQAIDPDLYRQRS